RAVTASLLVSLTAAPGLARPGPYLVLGLGGTSVSGQDVSYSQLHGEPAIAGGPALSTAMDGGVSGTARLGFNILGYAALEAVFSGNGRDFQNKSDRDWAMHLHGGVRVYPWWAWRYELPRLLQPLEPSL